MPYFCNIRSLNKMKQLYGIESMLKNYKNTLKSNRNLAVHLTNDATLPFSTLYLLFPSLIENNMVTHCTPRNKFALKIYSKALNKDSLEAEIDALITIDESLYYNTLKWMVQNCDTNEETDDDYAKVMDTSLSLLLLKYKDKSILNVVTKLIFKRCKEDHYYHDLVWALFQLNEPVILEKIAPYLDSSDELQKNLAAKFLNFNESNTIKTYEDYLRFVRENEPYFHFTNQCFNLSSTPIFLDINIDAKYLCKPIVKNNTNILSLLTAIENEKIDKFHELEHQTQWELANYSNTLYRENKRLWRAWQNFSIMNQIATCKKEMGDQYD